MLAASSIYEHPGLTDSDVWYTDKHPQALNPGPNPSKLSVKRLACSLLGLVAFAGSITYLDPRHFQRVCEEMDTMNVRVIGVVNATGKRTFLHFRPSATIITTPFISSFLPVIASYDSVPVGNICHPSHPSIFIAFVVLRSDTTA
ncbi:hypothetical protein H0H92_013387 [Tricholoma furcatifolium]|nr:hypothetical protein H0H92_013387 [Tricholoma furcatifolium]